MAGAPCLTTARGILLAPRTLLLLILMVWEALPGEGHVRLPSAAAPVPPSPPPPSIISISLSVAVSEDNSRVAVNISGPADRWYGVGFNAQQMMDTPDTLITSAPPPSFFRQTLSTPTHHLIMHPNLAHAGPETTPRSHDEM